MYCFTWRVPPDSSRDVSPALRVSRGREKAEIFLLSPLCSSGHCPLSGSFSDPIFWAHKLQDRERAVQAARAPSSPFSPLETRHPGPPEVWIFSLPGGQHVCVTPKFTPPSTLCDGLWEVIRLR